MTAPVLVDTNILVYRFDPRFPDKQRRATAALSRGLADEVVRVPHQAVIEFVAAVTRPRASGEPLLSISDALHEAEEIVTQFPVIYPNEAVVRLALRGAAFIEPLPADDIVYVRNLGLVRTGAPIAIANPIYRELSRRVYRRDESVGGAPVSARERKHPRCSLASEQRTARTGRRPGGDDR